MTSEVKGGCEIHDIVYPNRSEPAPGHHRPAPTLGWHRARLSRAYVESLENQIRTATTTPGNDQTSL
ncbi:hypothetical protein ACIRRA_34800 [Nocardia sp. NPDC101769]|uniref:hypothetical protein n=1 Tax=Nocardia sp. NPDC101769 TaxID=3364333 RepID=UPI003828E3B4